MKAVIMAGGKGTRLYPLTATVPKPLLPVAGIPAIKRIISHIKSHGITEAAVTLGYLADKIEAELGCEYDGVRLTYFKEDHPLGTAGGVKQCKDFIGNDDFIVISGDTVCNTDLTSAAKTRKEKDSLVTIVLTRVPDPGEYGVVLVSDKGDIIGFNEKPSITSTFADTVSTGIYIMSPSVFDFIPDGECDFGRDIFPKLLQDRQKLTAVTDENYWCDIGDHHSYRMANLFYQNGGNAVGRECIYSSESTVGSVLLDRVRVGIGTKIENSIIASDTVIGKNCIINENCVIGEGSTIGDGVILGSGTVLDQESYIPEFSHIKTGASISRSALSSMLDSDGMVCEIRRMTPSFCMRLGSAMTDAFGSGRIGIMTDGKPDSLRISSAFLRGIGMAGGESMVLGEGFEAAASYASVFMSLDLSVFVRCDGEECHISFYDCDGLYPKREFERALLSSVSKDLVSKEQSPPRRSSCSFTEEYYLPMVIRNRCSLDGLKISIKNENSASTLMKRALLMLGADICDDGIKLSLSDDGFSLSVVQDGFVADDYHVKGIILKYLIRHSVSLPVSTPASLIDICYKKALLYTHCPSGDHEDDARKKAKNTPELIHGCVAAAELTGLIAVSEKSIKELSEHLPDFAVSNYDYKTKDRSHLTILPYLGTPSGDGIISEYEKGSVRVIPTRDGYKLMSEAASGEYAEELISLSEKEIKNLLKKLRKD